MYFTVPNIPDNSEDDSPHYNPVTMQEWAIPIDTIAFEVVTPEYNVITAEFDNQPDNPEEE